MVAEAGATHDLQRLGTLPLMRILAGGIAGLLAGLLYSALLASQQMSPMMSTSDVTGDAFIHLLLSAAVGLVFGLIHPARSDAAGRNVVWGVAFGSLWWLLGPLTVFPFLHNARPTWDIGAARAAFPQLLGLAVVFGASMGLIYAALVSLTSATRRNIGRYGAVSRQVIEGAVSGGVAGLLGGWVFGQWMAQVGFFPLVAGIVNAEDAATGQWLHFAISVLIGITYGVLFQKEARTLGACIAFGMVYGLLWWVIGALTIMPFLLGDGVQWTLNNARASFPSLIGHLVYGIVLGLTQAVLIQLWRTLFIDSDPLMRQPEGPGTRSLRGLTLGAVASIAGGLAFTTVMLATDSLPVVARLMGMSGVIAGFLTHMLISIVIGASYGLLFRAEATSPSHAIGWGMVYGLVWWVLGPLTLMPILLGLPVEWSIEVATAAFPSLFGHLLYGIALSVVFQQLLLRYAPAPIESAYVPFNGSPLWLIVALFAVILLLVLTALPTMMA